MQIAIGLLLTAMLATPTAFSAAESGTVSVSTTNGIKVGKMSGMRLLVSAEEVETQAGQQYAGLKREAQGKHTLAPDSDPQVLRLRRIANQLIPLALRWNERAPKWQWEINLVTSPELNACCLPGGKIVFHSGILQGLKLTDDEVAVVMGHEIAHALREHGRERMAKAGATKLAARLAEAGISSRFKTDPNVTHSVVGGVAGLAILKFSRADETEADLIGLDLAARAGYDPRAGVMLWQKMGMRNTGAPPQWLSTHPAGENRIAEIRKHLPEVMPLYAKAKQLPLAQLPAYQSNVPGLAAVN